MDTVKLFGGYESMTGQHYLRKEMLKWNLMN